MNILDFYEELYGEIAGHSGLDDVPVIVRLPDNTEISVVDVRLGANWESLVISTG